jgi:uncharacterized protein (DUF1697 family)
MLEHDMAVVISLLRGINVGGHHKIKMDALRELYCSLGLREPQTYVNSGNVVFRTDATDMVRLSHRIEKGIEGCFGFRPSVIVRTPSELREAIARNPFAARRDIHPSRLLVTFLAAVPGPDACRKVLGMEAGTEELHIAGREFYMHFPDGMGRPKVSWVAVEKALKTVGTGRNWHTVNKLLEIAEKLEAS